MRRLVRRLALLSTFVLVCVPLVASVAVARTISCTGGGDCVGTPKHDFMRGGPGDDRMVGRDGDDRMLGGDGQDVLKGKGGSGTLDGGEGDDRAEGGSGRDTASGGVGDDIIRGGSHGGTNDGVHDALDCGDGVDTVYYVENQDSISDCEIFNPPE